MSDTERKVRDFLRENFILGDEALDGDASLTRSGVLDSMGVLELIMFVESDLGVRVPDEDTLPENFDSVDRIVAYLDGRTAASHAG